MARECNLCSYIVNCIHKGPIRPNWDITQKGGILVFQIGMLDITLQNWDIDLLKLGYDCMGY